MTQQPIQSIHIHPSLFFNHDCHICHMVGLSKMSKLIQTGIDIIDLPDLPGSSLAPGFYRNAWRLPISPGKEPGTRGEPDEGTLPASRGNPAPDGNQACRVAGLQGYRITGLQGYRCYRVTGTLAYRVPLELFSSMVAGASNGAGFPWRWASPWPGFSLAPGALYGTGSFFVVPGWVPPWLPAGAGFLPVCRVPP